MPLPVAHGLLGASVVAALGSETSPEPSRMVLLGAFLGVLPDFDYLLNWVRVFGRGWHHDFTHSFVFSLLVGLCASVGVGAREARPFLAYSGATLSHPLLDYVMTESGGVELFWPVSDRRFKLGIDNPIDYTWSQESAARAAGDLLRISLIEAAVFVPVLAGVFLMKRALARRASPCGRRA